MTSTGTLHAKHELPDGTNASGSITITVNTDKQVIRDPVGNIVFQGPLTVKLVNGEKTVTLPASDDATLEPTDFTYTVTERLDHVSKANYRTADFQILTGETVHTADLASSSEVALDPSYGANLNGIIGLTDPTFAANLKASIDARTGHVYPATVTDSTGADTANTAALIAAMDAAITADTVMVLPEGIHYVDGTVEPTVSGGTLRILAEGQGAVIRASSDFGTGYVVAPGDNEFELLGKGTIYGRDADGVYCFGAMEGIRGRCSLGDWKFTNAEYGVRFEGASEFPFGLDGGDLYPYGHRTCGIAIGTGGTSTSGQGDVPTSGQSAWNFKKIMGTNGSAVQRSIPATGFTETPNTPNSTHDKLDWAGTDAKEFGYVIMRRPAASVDSDDWEWVANVARSGSTPYTYSAVKGVGEDWTYRVVRRSVGTFMRHGKVVNVATLQGDYYTNAGYFEDCIAVNVGGVYYEWRGNDITDPTPQGSGIIFTDCGGVTVGGGHVEAGLSAVEALNTEAIQTGPVEAQDCVRSAVHVVSTSAGYTVDVGLCKASGTTPERITNDGGAFSWNIAGHNLHETDDTVANRHHVDHTYIAEHVVDSRGVRSGALGVDGTSAYVELTAAGLPAAGSGYAGQVRRNGTELFVCGQLASVWTWLPLGAAAHGASFSNASTVTIPTASETTVEGGTEVHDTDGYHDTVTNNSRITIPAGRRGLYLIVAGLRFSSSATGHREIGIKKNGSGLTGGTLAVAAASDDVTIIRHSVVALLDVGDYVQFTGYQTSGGDLTVPAGFGSLSATYLGAA